MRVTSKGQVTIPAHVREDAGIMPNTDVDFVLNRSGRYEIVPRRGRGKALTRGEQVIAHMQRFAKAHPIRMTTDEIMALTRGDD